MTVLLSHLPVTIIVLHFTSDHANGNRLPYFTGGIASGNHPAAGDHAGCNHTPLIYR